MSAKGKGGRDKSRGEGGLSGRGLHTKVRSAKGRKLSSTLWLQRQLNDPYVAEAQKRGYPSRAAFKLLELDDKYHFLKPGKRIVDLGAAPGGWTKVAVERTDPENNAQGLVVALDINEMEPVSGAKILLHDFLDEAAPDLLKEALGGKVDIVLSDMAAPATGHAATDHLKIMALCEAALEFAFEMLKPDGVFIAKVLQGGTENDMLKAMKKDFKTVRHVKPPASRSDSAEMYVVATGYRGEEQGLDSSTSSV
ncbi:MAG: RlmE family RNA methyltransferase [Rhodospirillaceae bacterium]|nr:RlmE family RNA methyltransferase [Rhodospirillaceae bacterium]MBL6929959.1 RlmE family RNA methyltransferase [Rhodospirillales bacterium]